MMQAIMWVILGATLAVAALVDSHKTRSLEVRLGDPIPLTNATIRVPRGWLLESPEESTSTIQLREPGMEMWGRTIEIEIGKSSPAISLFKLFSGSSSKGTVDKSEVIPFGDADGTLVTRHVDDDGRFSQFTGARVWRFTATRDLRDGRFVTLMLEDIGQPDKRERVRDANLVKEMAASFKLAPTTQP
jgi:hypothetical protein